MAASLAVLVFGVGVAGSAAADPDVPVRYKVDGGLIKKVPATTQLTFELYSDKACTSLVADRTTPIGDPNLVISQLKRTKPPGSSGIPGRVAEIAWVMEEIPVTAELYLKIPDVISTGGDCQPQGAFPGGSSGTITGITAGSGLSGGGTSGIVTLNVNSGNGLTTGGSLSVNAPTCVGTEKLTWNGTAFQCASDQTGSGISCVVRTSTGAGAGHVQACNAGEIATGGGCGGVSGSPSVKNSNPTTVGALEAWNCDITSGQAVTWVICCQ